ncbi:hypothetical protein GO594_28730, partial [Pseudomonas otitidis]
QGARRAHQPEGADGTGPQRQRRGASRSHPAGPQHVEHHSHHQCPHPPPLQPPAPPRCPPGGPPHQCALAGGDAQPCWCFSAEIDPEALRQVPLEARDRACLCPRCARLRADDEPA